MERSFERELDCYVEKHHVIPKCMGGDNKSRNIAILTPEEHYVAHLLLVKIYPTNYQLVYAANMMGSTHQAINYMAGLDGKYQRLKKVIKNLQKPNKKCQRLKKVKKVKNEDHIKNETN